jgi:hypothetical protein
LYESEREKKKRKVKKEREKEKERKGDMAKERKNTPRRNASV